MLDFISLALPNIISFRRAIKIKQSCTGIKWAKAQALIEFLLNQLYFDHFDRTFMVHVSNMRVLIFFKVGTWDDSSHTSEIQAFQTDWCHFSIVTFKRELVEGSSFFVYFEPSVLFDVCKYLIFSLEAKLEFVLAT